MIKKHDALVHRIGIAFATIAFILGCFSVVAWITTFFACFDSDVKHPSILFLWLAWTATYIAIFFGRISYQLLEE